jgi:hypothetical protein
MSSRVERQVSTDLRGRHFDMAHELGKRYAGFTVPLGQVSLLDRLREHPVTEAHVEEARAAGDSVMWAVRKAQVGLTADTPVIVRGFTNAGFRGIEVHVERADERGRHLTFAVAEMDEALLSLDQ